MSASSLAAFLAACGGTGGGNGGSGGSPARTGSPPRTPTGVLRVALPADPASIDPSLVFSAQETAVTNSVYDGLTQWNEDWTELVPGLAERWEVSDDGREWQFFLRSGAKFHDGEPLTSEAVKKSFEYNTRKESAMAFTIGSPTEMKAADPKVFVVRYKQAFPDLARNQTLTRILSPKLLAGSNDAVARAVASKPVGSGPFRFAERKRGTSIRLEANPDYWGTGPYFETLALDVIPDENARTSALRAGDIDLVMEVPPLAVRTLNTGKTKIITQNRPWTTMMVDLQCDRGPVSDVRARQAVAYAIDRTALVDSVMRGNGTVIQSLLPPGVYGYHEPSRKYDHDPGRARELLREAGVAPGTQLGVVVYASVSLGSQIAQAVAAQLRDVGFDATSKVLDDVVGVRDMFSPDRKYELHIQLNGWVNGGPFHLAAGLVTSRSHYKGARLLKLVKEINSVSDGPKRLKLLAEAQEVLAVEIPELPLFLMKRNDGADAALEGYVPTKTAIPTFRTAYMSAEK